MKFEDYTPEQQKAIISKGQNIIVSAGAGSGKTQVLTGRVLHFVKNEGYKLKNFLILTFTNLAAAEMKARIRKTLKEENLEEANNVDIASICTFDAYALSIVKKYHFMLGISSSIKNVDSNIIDVKKRKIIDQIFEEEYGKQNKEFISLIEAFCFKDDEEIKKLLLNFYNKALMDIDFDNYLDNFVNHYYSDEAIRDAENEVIELFKSKREEILLLADRLPKVEVSSKDSRTVYECYDNYLEMLKLANSYDEFIHALDEEMESVSLPKGLGKEAQDDKKKLNEQIKKFRNYIGEFPETEEEFFINFRKTKCYSKTLIELVRRLDKEIADYKNKYQVFEFNDIAKMALKLVRDNKEVRESIKNELKMIMIDEYQDTSGIQETFVNYIADNNVYMVGDVKQSIYRFRNANCDIFVDKYNRYKNNDGGIAIDLNKNFRSRKEVLDDINYIFKQIMSDNYGGANYLKDHVIEYGNKAYKEGGVTKDNHHLEYLTYKKEKSNECAEIEANLIARDIINKINSKYEVMDSIKENGKDKAITRPSTFSDFCILMDRGSEFETISKVFNEYKIPLYVECDEDISNNDLVAVLTNVLYLMKAVMDNDYSSKEFIKAYLSVARSFIFEYSDEQLLKITKNKDYYNEDIMVKFRNVINEYNYLPISYLFEKIVNELEINHKFILLGDVTKNEKYLETFLGLFNSMSELDYTIDDFITYMNYVDEYKMKINLSSSSSSFDSVKIMNIHKSKGLEFKIVYYAGLYHAFNQKDLEEKFGISSKYGIILPENDFQNISFVKEINKRMEKKEDISEKIRLFYVALTRAKEKMICLMPLEMKDEQEETEEKKYKNEDYINDLLEIYQKGIITLDRLKIYCLLFDVEIDDNLKIIDPIYEYDEKEEKENILNRIETFSKNNDISLLLKLMLKEEPYETLIKDNINKLKNREIDVSTLEKFLKFINYEIVNEDVTLIFKKIYEGSYKEGEEAIFLSKLFDKYLKYNYSNYKELFSDVLVKLNDAFEEYKNDNYSLEEFKQIITCFNYEFDKDFSLLKDKKSINDIEEVIVEKGKLYNLKDSLSFYAFMKHFLDYRRFNNYAINLDERRPLLNNISTYKEDKKLIIEEVNLDIKEIKVKRASKNLEINSNKKNMEFGTKIHFIMEVTDFKNPDYSYMDSFYKGIVEKFLASPLMKDIEKGNAYKEYEFYDDKENVNGIIDLMVVYPNHIDIIDYKTKDIDDEAYNNQLKSYGNYVKRTFNKDVNLYLYSLLLGEYKKI